MGSVVCQETKEKLVGDVITNYTIEYADTLLPEEVLETIESFGALPADGVLQLSADVINSGNLTNQCTGETIPAETAVVFTGASGTPGMLYWITAYVTTSLGRTLGGVVKLFVTAGIPNTLTTTTTTQAP